MLDNFDTIAAISTPIGNGGIGIVRISGEKSLDILLKIFKTNKKLESHRIYYGNIIDLENNIVDEVLVNIMLSPKTYTKEDIVEINCHGGIVSVTRVLELVLGCGARLADPGEFTKRAFLNGRIDLSQAEAVIDVINAKASLSHQNAINQLEGKLSNLIKNIRDEILLLIANIETSIDYPEHDMENENMISIEESSKKIINKIAYLLSTTEKGKLLREGIETVIIGSPNVGKSSLLNNLLFEDRAIVTDIPGTTRDILYEYINIDGIMLKLVDTAGIRETTDEIEQIGVEKSKEYANKADLILFMLDANKDISEDELSLIDSLKEKNIVVIINKIDLENKIELSNIEKYVERDNMIYISLKNNQGIELLYEKIKGLFFDGEISMKDDVFVTSVRQKGLLKKSIDSLKNAINMIEQGFTEDLISIDLKDSYSFLGEIIGETLDDDIIDKIFKEFCLGK